MTEFCNLASRPDLVRASVDLAWNEWGAAGLPEGEYDRWLRLAEHDCRRNCATSAAFVAVEDDAVVGVVSLHEFDIASMRDRSPWVCGMVVAPTHRGLGIGQHLLNTLGAFARTHDVAALWVFTESAHAFYEKCGWTVVTRATEEGHSGVVLTTSTSRFGDKGSAPPQPTNVASGISAP